jgi:hypothetical protein
LEWLGGKNYWRTHAEAAEQNRQQQRRRDRQRRVENLVKNNSALDLSGKTLDQIQQELRMPEYENVAGEKERIGNNIEAAYRTIQGGYRP